MAHEIAKLLLEHAGTALERGKAIQTAVQLGMPLSEVDEYLEWLSLLRGKAEGNGQEASGKESAPP